MKTGRKKVNARTAPDHEDLLSRITIDPNICHGKPCITGTRIQVAQVLDLAAAGKSFREIIGNYFPDLTEDDIRACLEFARDLVQNEDIHVVEEV